MGESFYGLQAKNHSLRVNFNRNLRLEFHGSSITSDAGLIAYRELDNTLGLTEIAAKKLKDIRSGKNKQHSLAAQLRQSVFSRLAGYEDTNGHFGCMCYHPLFCFNQFGDVEYALLREGNGHSAKDWKAVLKPIIARYRNSNIPLYFRGDAGFTWH